MIFIVILISVAFCEACGIYDATMTEKGLKAGVAVEGFDWLVGKKPSAVALYLRDNLLLGLCSLPAILCATVFHNVPLAYGACISPVLYGIKHIQGGLAWKKLLGGK
jgi:hypothetical protein